MKLAVCSGEIKVAAQTFFGNRNYTLLFVGNVLILSTQDILTFDWAGRQPNGTHIASGTGTY